MFGVGGGSDESDEEAGDADATAQKELGAREEKLKEREARRAKRIALAKAAANAPPPPCTQEDDWDLAARALHEAGGRSDAVASGRGKRGRGNRPEGTGTRHIRIEGLTLSVAGDQGDIELFKNADLSLFPGRVYGLVGKNGSGKTTLLRRLAARALPDLPDHLRFGYVAQELGAARGDHSALESVLQADEVRCALLREQEELATALAHGDSHALAVRFAEVERELEVIDADDAEDRAREALTRLGFDEAMMQRPVAELSGGWRMRVALVRALFSRPDVLLLDEPTNHLDLHGVLWLQDHLRRAWGADAKKSDRIVVIVSHDRSFMDACVTDVIEVHAKKLQNFTGDYTAYTERLADEQRVLQNRKDEAERQERAQKREFALLKKKAREHHDDKKVAQLKANEKKAGQALKLSSMRTFGEGGREDLIAKLREDTSLRFRFPCPDAVPDGKLLEMDGAIVRLGGTAILRRLTLALDMQSRVAIVGANGAGKSTLLRALAGDLPADEGPDGRGRRHVAFSPGYVSQDHLERQTGHLSGSCLDYLRQLLPDAEKFPDAPMNSDSDDSKLWAHLGNFGLGRDALKKVGYLSGGQKARLSLAAATWWEPSCLILDEPTNHLDLDSLDALSLGLQAFPGAVVVVSHNSGFVSALCDELWVVRDGTVKACPRGEEAFAQYFAEYTKSVERGLA